MVTTFFVLRLLHIIHAVTYVYRFKKLALLYYPIYYPIRFIGYISKLVWNKNEKKFIKENENPCVVTINQAPDFVEWDIISL